MMEVTLDMLKYVQPKRIVKTIQVNTHKDEVEDKLLYPLFFSVILVQKKQNYKMLLIKFSTKTRRFVFCSRRVAHRSGCFEVDIYNTRIEVFA